VTQVTPAAVAAEVRRQGGSLPQAWVAAALTDGIESSGDSTVKNPTSTACGLFQFLTTTWQSNGGGAYAPNACAAPWQAQVTVFLNATQGNNFYPWAPDLGGSYNGNTSQAAATVPQPGSNVANHIASLAAGGTMKFLGNVPTAWASAGGATPANPAPGPLGAVGGLVTGGTSSQLPGTGGGWASELGTLLGDLTSTSWWKRVGLFSGGLVLIIGGIVLFVSTTKTGESVKGAGELAAVAA
jgi:hypothetical protein